MNCATPGSDWKLRKPVVRSAQGSTTPEMHSRRHSGGVSSLHQSRSKQIHQSNGSIQSDSPSSNSISPAPSPSPRPQSVNTNNGSVGLGKRWNSTGDFNSQSALTGRYVNHIYSSSMRSFHFIWFLFIFDSFIVWLFFYLNVIIIFYGVLFVVCVFYFVFILFFAWIFRLSTKSLLNLSTKTVPGHILKHGYVLMIFIL